MSGRLSFPKQFLLRLFLPLCSILTLIIADDVLLSTGKSVRPPVSAFPKPL